MSSVRVELPAGLSQLAGIGREVSVVVEGPVTVRAILDAVEAAHPTLRGAIRDRATQRRRPFIRFFACQEDFSHACVDAALPEPVGRGSEAFLIVGAIAGG
jgi:molybdopterin synthase sulfur carrier subunit